METVHGTIVICLDHPPCGPLCRSFLPVGAESFVCLREESGPREFRPRIAPAPCGEVHRLACPFCAFYVQTSSYSGLCRRDSRDVAVVDGDQRAGCAHFQWNGLVAIGPEDDLAYHAGPQPAPTHDAYRIARILEVLEHGLR